jgi:uncharacterized protein involved in exopolysaccharide biosynthesis
VAHAAGGTPTIPAIARALIERDDSNGEERQVDDASLLPLVRRWWRLLLLGAILGGVGGFIAASVLPKTYTSEADLLVGPLNTDSGLDASGSLSATYQNLATSRPVLRAAIDATGAKLSVDSLATDVTSTSNTVTRIVTVSVDNHDAGLAARLANAITARLTALADRLPTQAADQLQAFGTQPEVQALSTTTQAAIRLAVKRVFGPSVAGQLTTVNAAVPARSASSPKKPLIVVLGAVAGLLLTGLFVLLRDPRAAPPPEPDPTIS